MRYRHTEAPSHPHRRIRTDYRGNPQAGMPPIYMRQYAAPTTRQHQLAELRLMTHGYQYDDRLDLWTKDGKPDVCIRDGQVLELSRFQPDSLRDAS